MLGSGCLDVKVLGFAPLGVEVVVLLLHSVGGVLMLQLET